VPNELGKGPRLEYIVSGLFQNQGYLTRRSIPLQYGNRNQDATDIDIIGHLFTLPFQMHTIICDCKNKQKSKPYERIFWAKGLAQFVGASDVYVSLPQASWDTVKFAQKGNVRIITFESIKEYSKRNAYLYGLADDDFYINFFNNLNNEIKQNKQLYDAFIILKGIYLNEDPYVTINVAIDLIQTSGKNMALIGEKGTKDNFTFWKYICCESLIIVGLNILKICVDTFCLPSKAREQHILSKLTYGDIDPTKINKILKYAKNVANEMVKASIPKTALPKASVVDFGEISPPHYAYSIVGIVERAILNPEWYINLPQVLDFILFEFAVKNKEFSMEIFKTIFNTEFTNETLKAAKNLLIFARNVCKVNIKLLWDSSDSFMTKKNEQTNEKIDTSSTNCEIVNTLEQTTLDDATKVD